jgi:hypothetical protein
MDNYPFDTHGLGSDEIDRFNDTWLALKTKFDVQATGTIDFNLEQFEVFSGHENIRVIGSFVIKEDDNNDTYILFIESHTKTRGTKTGVHAYYEYQTWAIAFLKCNFGRVLIRRETLADKIMELVHPIELDFDDDKPFSDTFYVLVNDHVKAAAAMNRNFRNAVMDIREDNFIIEISEHTLLIGDQKPMFPERAVYLAEFVSRVASLC